MDPVEIQTNIDLSRVAAGTVAFNKAVERHSDKKCTIYGGIQLIDACEAAWAVQANVTTTLEAGIVANCNKLTIAGAFTTGLVATKDLTLVDLSGLGAMNVLLKCDAAQAAGVFQIGVSETITMGGSPVLMDVPAMAADTWYYFSIAYSGVTSARNAVLSCGINAVSDPGAVDLWVDEVRSGALGYGIAGFADDDQAQENEYASIYEDVHILGAGNINADLQAGQTCVAEQPLYPVPGTGELTATEIVAAYGRSITATEDQATAGGRVGVRF